MRSLHRVEGQVGQGLLILYMSLNWIRNFPFNQAWRGRHYRTKQVEVYAVHEGADWLVITVITRYF